MGRDSAWDKRDARRYLTVTGFTDNLAGKYDTT